jgi:hypothetical protein
VHARIGLLAALLASGASAQEPPPGGIPDLTGPRALALSASVGVPGGNDAIFENPAALAARRRYSVEASFFTDRRDAGTMSQFFGASVVDSVSAPVTAGLAYERASEGAYTGNLFHLALAGPLAQGLTLGVSGTFYSVDGPDPMSAASVDAGLFWQVGRYLSIGAAGHNLVPAGNDQVAPRSVAAGFAAGSDQSLQVMGEWSADLDRAGETRNRFAAGLEYLLARMVPLRAGWAQDELLDTQWWSAGAGIVTRSVAIDLGYRQSLDAASAQTLAVSLRVFPSF